MANQDYINYTINDFDNFDCLKLSKGIYFLLIFVLRGYVVWLVSVANMKDHTSFIQWVFPDTKIFYLSLFSGCIGLFVLLIMSLRRPTAPLWVKQLWPKSRILLIIALLFDLLVHFIAFMQGTMLSIMWLLTHGVVVSSFIIYCFSSKRLKINLAEFPVEITNNTRRK